MEVYINKAELLKELSVIQDRPVHSAIQIIKILPTIDIVRCGECRWWDKDGKRKDGKGWCENVICGLTEPNAFCSYGERRADEEH